MKNYVSKIQELEAELLRVRTFATPKGDSYIDCVALDKDRLISSLNDLGLGSDGNSLEESSKFIMLAYVLLFF